MALLKKSQNYNKVLQKTMTSSNQIEYKTTKYVLSVT